MQERKLELVIEGNKAYYKEEGWEGTQVIWTNKMSDREIWKNYMQERLETLKYIEGVKENEEETKMKNQKRQVKIKDKHRKQTQGKGEKDYWLTNLKLRGLAHITVWTKFDIQQ